VMLERWRQGDQVVCARRRRRAGESRFKRATAWAFYRLLNALSAVPIPADTGDFRLMDGSVVGEFRKMRETNRFVRGLVAWIGHRQSVVEFDRPARHAGQPKYNLARLAALSVDAVVSFSTRPLRLAGLLGLLTLVAGVVVLLWVGWSALAVSALIALNGVQMLLIGLLGEYVARIHTQLQNRPLYVVREEA